VDLQAEHRMLDPSLVCCSNVFVTGKCTHQGGWSGGAEWDAVQGSCCCDTECVVERGVQRASKTTSTKNSSAV